MNARQVWQSQALDAPRMSLAYVRHRASGLERRTQWRNALEYGVGVLVCAMCGFIAYQQFAARPLMSASMVLMALWSLYYVYRWHQLASAKPVPAEAGVLDTLRYQRQQLEQQRDLRRRSWRWWGLPLLPALALLLASMVLEHDPVPWGGIAFLVAWLFAGTAIGLWILESEARRFQREIDALDSLASD
jgi:hypothetical protein